MTTKLQTEFSVDAILVPAHTFSRGRPSNAQEIQIERKLRDCFTKFYSTSFTVEHTGHDVKTVKKYFKKFKDELMQNEEIDFPQRFSEAKERNILALDEILHSLYHDKDEIEQQIIDAKNKNDSNLAEKLYRTKLKFIEEIKNTLVEKMNLIGAPMPNDFAKVRAKFENQYISDNTGTKTHMPFGFPNRFSQN